MTKDQYTKLNEYEVKLELVRRTGYTHITRSDFNKIHEVYKDVFKKELNKSQQNCPRCVVKALNELAVEYFKYKEKLEARESKKKEKNDGDE